MLAFACLIGITVREHQSKKMIQKAVLKIDFISSIRGMPALFICNKRCREIVEQLWQAVTSNREVEGSKCLDHKITIYSKRKLLQ